MIPQIGQHIRCLLINNTLIEGIIKEWNTSIITLQSLNDDNILIIHHPERDIIFTKIILNKTDIKDNLIKTELENKFTDEFNSKSDDELRIKKLSELRVLMAKQDKKIISEKLKDHNVGVIKQVEYNHGLFKK